MFEFFLSSQYFAIKFRVKNVGLTGLTETTWFHVNLTLYIYICIYIYYSELYKLVYLNENQQTPNTYIDYFIKPFY